jgi:hypothetical protein
LATSATVAVVPVISLVAISTLKRTSECGNLSQDASISQALSEAIIDAMNVHNQREAATADLSQTSSAAASEVVIVHSQTADASVSAVTAAVVSTSELIFTRGNVLSTNNCRKRGKQAASSLLQVEKDNTPCAFCEITYEMSNCMWFQCAICSKWACGKCAKVWRRYVCDGCK